jgi:hypothetical protein
VGDQWMNHNLLLQLREITKLMSKITLTLHAKYLNMQDNKAPAWYNKIYITKMSKIYRSKFFCYTVYNLWLHRDGDCGWLTNQSTLVTPDIKLLHYRSCSSSLYGTKTIQWFGTAIKRTKTYPVKTGNFPG